MISYDGWDREYQENKEEYLTLFDSFMSQLNYENIDEFDEKFATFIGRKYAVSVSNATEALRFALLANNIGEGDEVIVTDFSWISSASVVSMTKATPVFCDIDLHSYHLSFDSIKKMYSNKVKAIIYVHLFGNMVDTTEIQNFCKEKNILFIEDSAQNLGSSLNFVRAGTIGDCSVFSFNTNKVIAGINGGGMFLTDDEHIYKKVKLLRKYGKNLDFNMLGFNSRMYVLNSKIIELRLKNLEKTQLKRQFIAQIYNENLKNLPVVVQSSTNQLNHSFHKYTVRFENKFIRNFVKKNLQASVHYELPLSLNSMYRTINHRKDNCNNSKLVSDTILSLPIHAWLYDNEISKIIQLTKEGIKNGPNL